MTYHLITEAERKELNEMICGRGGSLARAHAILHAVQEREGPKRVAWLTDRETLYFDKEDARRDCDGFIRPLYTLPEEPK